MKIRTLVLASFAILFSFSAEASLVFDWRPGGNQGLQGWTNVLADSTTFSSVSYVYQFFDRGSALGPPQANPATVGANPNGGNWQDTPHTTLVAQSPTFAKGTFSHIEFELDSGSSTATLPANFASLPTNTVDSNANGFLGVALMRISDGAYLLQATKSLNGPVEKFVWNSTVINGAIAGDALTETYALQLIDYQHGSWGHIGLRTATIAVPEPTTVGILGIAISSLLLRRRRRSLS